MGGNAAKSAGQTRVIMSATVRSDDQHRKADESGLQLIMLGRMALATS